ncbi:EAL domain-containing protein [Malaciobacter marinus]|uniref:EAL domain-containing protein n=1 Tax=Malaciobacter marinus TaxID=505249 RepID=UPI003B00C3ED
MSMKNSKNIQEVDFIAILKNYNFSLDDGKKLASLHDIIVKYEDSLIIKFYEFIFNFEYAKSFLKDKDTLKRHEEGIKNWYKNLFCGKYELSYFENLNFISEVHVRIGLPAHYVNAAFSFIRGFLIEVLISENKIGFIDSLNKIIDINLDILTLSYRQVEQSKLLKDVLFLKKVVESGSIEPYLQAIFNTKTMKIEKYESLMRLIDISSFEVYSVFPYLEVSKKIKLYEKMMRMMIEKTFLFFNDKEVEFSINLSYEDISNKSFIDFLYKMISSFKRPSNIIFEILETDFIEDFDIVVEFTKSVRMYGCKIAIDDFGSGFSSMENILKLKPEYIKIDGSLIKNLHISKESQTLVKNITNIAKDLNCKTVAEYVDCKEVFTIVKELNVDYLQGFYLHKPEKL